MAPATPLPATRPPLRPDIQGLRGLAVVLVVCFHAGFAVWRGAFVAVDVFFVLSGYFLTAALARHVAIGEPLRARDVVARRLWRLLPTTLIVVAITMMTVQWLYAPIDRVYPAQQARAVSLFGGNIALALEGTNYFSAGTNPFLHAWTLGIELQLAICWSVLFAWAANREGIVSRPSAAERHVALVQGLLTALGVLGVVSFALAVHAADSAPMWGYFGPHTRLWGFAAGGAVALVMGGGQSLLGTSQPRLVFAQGIGLAAILLPALLLDRSVPYPGMAALPPVIGTLLLLSGGERAAFTPIGRALASPRLMQLGALSFGWYLWHWPLMMLGEVLSPEITPYGRFAWGMLGLPLAWLTLRATAMAWQWSPSKPGLTAATTLMLVLLGASHVLVLRNGRAIRTGEQARYAAARSDGMSHSCWSGRTPRASSTCSFGATAPRITLALLGDSHAEHWLGGLEAAGAAHGWRIVANVKGGCPVPDLDGLVSGATARRYRDCLAFRRTAVARLVRQRPHAVILSNSDHYLLAAENGEPYRVTDAMWREGLRRTYRTFAASGIQVVVLRGTPFVPFDVPGCLSRRAARLPFAGDCTFTPDRAFAARAQRLQNEAARGLPVRFVDMNDVVCPTSRCSTTRGDTVVFTDDNHLTASFSRSLATQLGARLEAALR